MPHRSHCDLNFEDKIFFSISSFFRVDSPPANASGIKYWVFEIQVELDQRCNFPQRFTKRTCHNHHMFRCYEINIRMHLERFWYVFSMFLSHTSFKIVLHAQWGEQTATWKHGLRVTQWHWKPNYFANQSTQNSGAGTWRKGTWS